MSRNETDSSAYGASGQRERPFANVRSERRAIVGWFQVHRLVQWWPQFEATRLVIELIQPDKAEGIRSLIGEAELVLGDEEGRGAGTGRCSFRMTAIAAARSSTGMSGDGNGATGARPSGVSGCVGALILFWKDLPLVNRSVAEAFNDLIGAPNGGTIMGWEPNWKSPKMGACRTSLR